MTEMFDVEDVVDPTPEELRRQEIDQLKAGWASDPSWDEDVREELRQFRKDMEAKWAEQRMARLNKLAENLGFKVRPTYESGVHYVLDPEVFTEYMEKLLGNIAALEDKIELLENRIGVRG